MARKYEGMASGVYYQGESRAMALAGGGAMSTTAGGRWRGAGLQQGRGVMMVTRTAGEYARWAWGRLSARRPRVRGLWGLRQCYVGCRAMGHTAGRAGGRVGRLSQGATG